jgi:hypothetical protein
MKKVVTPFIRFASHDARRLFWVRAAQVQVSQRRSIPVKLLFCKFICGQAEISGWVRGADGFGGPLLDEVGA